MAKEKYESENSPSHSEEHGTLGPDVYENARKLNIQLATRGPAILYALGKASEQVTNSNVVTAVGGMVVGAIGFFGNRFYRNKGDDSAYTYMGQIVGAVQFTAGFTLLALQAFETFTDTGETTPLLNVVKLSGVALTLTESALILINSYLYGDGSAKTTPISSPKID
ncbi:TPA: hypothetical protein F8R96_15080 [Legionella pneumophila]|nr:hypothetical protein [Legionella pneumophila]HAU1322239.1 hypothetical protein [Legionella pneumophila]HBC0467879.1 hypothetical protein [Legionella pneumophila]HBI2947871.1 hypothetical protein [Legionella pneumophila]HDV6633210.1 hypothetical protein [Legionella pneumophila]